MKRTIKLNESELKRMIAESVKRVLRENSKHPLYEVYNTLKEAMDKLEGILLNDYDTDYDNYYMVKNLLKAITNFENCLDNFVSEPYGGQGEKIWNSDGSSKNDF